MQNEEMVQYRLVEDSFSIPYGDNSQSIKVSKDDEVFFDGKYTTLINGESYTMPKFKSAIRAKWVVPLTDLETQKTLKAAPLKVRHATIEGADSSFEGVVTAHRQEQPVSKVSDRRDARERAMRGEKFEYGGEAQKLEELAETGHEVKLARALTPAQYTGPLDEGLETMRERGAEPRKTFTEEGITFHGENLEAPKQPGVEEILEDASEIDLETQEGRFQVLKEAFPTIPDWDFKAHWKKKIKALDGIEAVYVYAIYSLETEKMRNLIKKNYGEAFE